MVPERPHAAIGGARSARKENQDALQNASYGPTDLLGN